MAGKDTAWTRPRHILAATARETEVLAARGNSRVSRDPINIADPKAALKPILGKDSFHPLVELRTFKIVRMVMVMV